MQKWHDSLMQKNGMYAEWHNHPKSQTFQWLALLLVVASVAWLIVGRANQQQLADFGYVTKAHAPSAGFVKLIPNGPAQDHILVKFKDNVGQTKKAEVLAKHNLKQISENTDIGYKSVAIPAGMTAEDAVTAISADPNVETAEPDSYASISVIPNDPDYPSQWHLPQISAPGGWDISTGSSGVIIAIIDSGVDTTHPDFAGKIVPGWNFVNNNSDMTPTMFHGTTVAGAAAADSNNSIGVAGVAWNNQIMPIIVVDSTGNATYNNIANGVTYAVDHGAKVINISIAGIASETVIQSAVNYAWSKGAVVVAAAGNYSSSEPMYPAADKNVIAVSATDSNNLLASFSEYGSWVSMAAPGVSIFTPYYPGGGYQYDSGTSYSSPIVAGVVALMFSVNPSLPNSQVVSLLENSADNIGDSQYFGHGLVDVQKALAAAQSASPSNPPPADTTAPSVPSGLKASAVSTSQINLTWFASSDPDDAASLIKYNVYRNGNAVGSVTGNASYSDTGLSPSTSYSYAVNASDPAGNTSAMSSSVNATTQSPPPPTDTTPPVVSITAPVNGSRVSGTNITIRVSASDNVGVARVLIYVDGKLLATDTASPYTASWNIKKVSSGNHTIMANAYDAAGNMATASISVTK